MKQKYKGILSAVMALSAVLAILGYYYSGWWQPERVTQPRVVTPAASSWTPNKQQLETISRLSGQLSMLTHPSAKSMRQSTLAMFGQHPMPSGQGQRSGYEGARPVYALTLTMVAGPVRYCIINGSLLSEGNRMADGAVVARIETKRVLITLKEERQWVQLDEETSVPGKSGPAFAATDGHQS